MLMLMFNIGTRFVDPPPSTLFRKKINSSLLWDVFIIRERAFNLKGGGGGGYGCFLKKNILIPNVAEQKYSDFGGGKKN